MNEDTTVIEALLRRERFIVVAGLVLITALAWWWVATGAGTGMNTLAMSTWQFPPPISHSMIETWTPGYALVMFSMWWIMMIAMMTPSAAPMILLYARAHRYEHKLGKIDASVAPTFSFLFGYLTTWLAFALIATGMQWALENAGLVHALVMWSLDPVFSAGLLIAAGLYQLSSLKNVCLEHCRSPAQFLAENFRPGRWGAFRMGLKHGIYCLGCCWFLMALLFAGGVMNLVWIAGLTILVLIEKIAPSGHTIARIAGLTMIAWGGWILLSPHIVMGL
jgi:predicted metal-binding membrane protein